MWDCVFLGIASLKQKREERWFDDLRIFLMLLCGNESLKQVPNFCFKFDDIIPRYGSTIRSSFLGAVEISEHKVYLKTFYGLLYNSWWIAILFNISIKFPTSKWNKVYT